MRKALIAAVLASSQLTGCFIFIPGPVVGAVADSLTGDRGEHCVPRGTVVGQRVDLGFNRVGVVEFVSKTPSSRCTDSLMPMRAAIALLPGGMAPVAVTAPKVELPPEPPEQPPAK